MEARDLVCFSHGMMSHPQGTKIKQMSALAESKGFAVMAPDYSSTYDPDERVAMLLALQPKASRHLVLVGSSMGGYVSIVAANTLSPTGIFLLAPAIAMPGYQESDLALDVPQLAAVHGWHDDVIPVSHTIDFCQRHQATLHLVDGDHRLLSPLPSILHWFGEFLDQILRENSTIDS